MGCPGDNFNRKVEERLISPIFNVRPNYKLAKTEETV
jgi:hypothetical protein